MRNGNHILRRIVMGTRNLFMGHYILACVVIIISHSSFLI